ncbi:MAG: septum site-determining protein MinC [Candidatus Accumulibacter sp.]|jgi:septum site-determining protein MinC|nr:septum site-determining protein MinC [Accumulibacter sp.]
MPRASKNRELIEFKGTTLPIVNVTLRSLNPERLAETAANLFGGDGFFDGDAAVLDFGQLAGETATPAAWAALRDVFARHGLRVIGVSGGAEALRESAAAAGLPGLVAFKRPARPAVEPKPAPESVPESVPNPAPAPDLFAEAPPRAESEPEPDPEPPSAPAAPPPVPTLIVDRPLRSGQQIYARGGDLVMLAAVNAGAEVIADGSIHIYAPLRGRALAGAGGETGARIFTTRFEAELVSIAGVYRTFEAGIPETLAGGPAQVRLRAGDGGDGEKLNIQALKTD